MPEAEISPAGEVLVEGHHVGELQGFRFTADRSAEGEDARAVKNAAQKALALEFEARADRFGAAANNDLALGSDGTLRWLGAPIAALSGGEDALKPRVVILADEQLTGPARDKVAARAERFVSYQIESQLKPLIDLSQAEQLTGLARGLAFQLVENFGLLNRRDVAEDVRSLDQEARGALRRLGVRFGAYHIFVPSLLKPAPAGLTTLLWALKHDARDKPGHGDVVTALAAGRTSIVTDPAYEPAFYRLAGFRNLGRRAVRVDILERLADLIRPAIAWKPGAGTRPEGAYDGTTFVVTPAMMSILGATADDMEAILKGLGYRAEAKPPEEVAAHLAELDANAGAEKPAEAGGAGGAPAAPTEAGQSDTAAPGDTAASETAAKEGGPAVPETAAATGTSDEAQAAETASDEMAADAAPATAGLKTVATETPQPGTGATHGETPETRDGDPGRRPDKVVDAEPKTTAESATPDANGGAATDGETEEDEEPKPVLVWRPARAEGRRRDARRGGERQPGRERRADGATQRYAGGKKEPGGKPKGQPRAGAHPDKPGDKRREKRQDKRQEKRPERIDPDSPFAKLAALKEELKK